MTPREQWQAAWKSLQQASGLAEDSPKEAWSMLAQAAEAYAKAKWAAKTPTPPPPRDTGAVFPNYGRAKGEPVKGAAENDLRFYKSGCERSLADPSKSKWHEKERALLEAIEAELEAR